MQTETTKPAAVIETAPQTIDEMRDLNATAQTAAHPDIATDEQHFVDDVTGQLNRRGLLDSYRQHAETGDEIIVIHLDLEGFQSINHLHGFEQGDLILATMADRMHEILPRSATIARVSGDEFIVIVKGDRPHGKYIAERIASACNEPIVLKTGGRASVGVRSGWDCGYANPSANLLRQATAALHDAKTKGARLVTYDHDIAARIAEREQAEIELRTAVLQQQLTLHGQPIVDVFENRVETIDLMLRWNHHERGLLAASSFIGIAEECDFIDDIDRWVVRQLCTYAALTHPTLHFSVNLSMRSISKPSSLRYILEMLSSSGVPTGRLHVDIAQSEHAVDVQSVIDSTKQLIDKGIGVAIDRFGHGFGTFATMMQMSVSTIKLDRSLTAMLDSPEGRGLAAAIIGYAKERGLSVVGTGVETEAQCEALKELGCRYQQGYYHQEPIALNDLIANLRRPGDAFSAVPKNT